MKTYNQTLANLIIQEIKPRCEKHNIIDVSTVFPPILLAGMCKALTAGKINHHRARKWLDERIGMQEANEKSGLTKEGCDLFDRLEIAAMNK